MAMKRGLGHMGCHALGHRFFTCRAEAEPEALGCVIESGAHKIILTLLTLEPYPMEIIATARVGA
jgi:hypothetical protein